MSHPQEDLTDAQRKRSQLRLIGMAATGSVNNALITSISALFLLTLGATPFQVGLLASANNLQRATRLVGIHLIPRIGKAGLMFWGRVTSVAPTVSLILITFWYTSGTTANPKGIIFTQNNIISKNRIVDYQNSLLIFKTLDKDKQLNKVNFYLNRLLPQYDDVINNKLDNWATPKEFLTVGYGDCEDYVIIKYFTLLKLGFDKNKLFLTAVNEKYTGGYHMVLTYFKEKNKSPLVLDNLSFRILDLKTRTDIKAEDIKT